MKASQMYSALAAMFSILVFFTGCDNTSDAPTDGTLSLSSNYAPTGFSGSAVPKGSSTVADTITISRARFVIRDIKFKSAGEDSINFKTEPIVLDLDLTGISQTVGVIPAKFGSFSRIEFDVHRVESTEVQSLPSTQQAQFQNFLAGERYSIIVEGTYTPPGGSPQAFTYRSKVDAKQKLDLDVALVINESSTTANATMQIRSYDWFRNQLGEIVDPRDTNNEGVIDENLKATIRVLKDNDKDGSKD